MLPLSPTRKRPTTKTEIAFNPEIAGASPPSVLHPDRGNLFKICQELPFLLVPRILIGSPQDRGWMDGGYDIRCDRGF